MTVAEMVSAVPVHGFWIDVANDWVTSALERGLIEQTGGSGGSARFEITDKGRAAINAPPQ